MEKCHNVRRCDTAAVSPECGDLLCKVTGRGPGLGCGGQNSQCNQIKIAKMSLTRTDVAAWLVQPWP